ncbi:ABC transporter family protein [Burkholderia pseudomallei TSV28]|uniref:ATP-binding cassette domain-containing protein n=1 Tax=Burkholderia pseudomallei TaxID=28450 RepID=UPI0005376D61|nr:ATP-binding cassette domain-containing protein [Burkholderia pseudomallei]KGX66363.1 ABC transporter family protein [Burkholderia pseudomallei TSV28]
MSDTIPAIEHSAAESDDRTVERMGGPDAASELPLLARVHRMLAAAVTEAGRALGRGVSFDALLAGLTDGKDAMGQVDVIGLIEAAKAFGLVVESVDVPAASKLGTTSLIAIDTESAQDQVLFFPSVEMPHERRAFRFNATGLCQYFEYRQDQVPTGVGVQWLRVDRVPYSATAGARDAGHRPLPSKEHMAWLWDVLLAEKLAFRYALIASLGSTLIGLAMPFFSLVIFNTVAPNGAVATLITLMIGMLVAIAADFVLREVRAYIIDVTARRIDVVLSRRIYEHLLDIKLESWTGVAGTQADMLRGFATVQEVFTSGVLLLLIDLPFGLIALAMVFVVGGHLGWVPVFWVMVLLALLWRMQSSVHRSSQLSMQLGQERHGTLVETINALETVRAVGGERVLRRRWRDQTAMAAIASGTSRMLTQFVAGVTTMSMQLESLMLLGIGAWMVGEKWLTLGGLIAANMLAGRALAPFLSIVSLGIRLESARIAAGFISRFFQMPRTTRETQEFVARSDFTGVVTLNDVSFAYPAHKSGRATVANVNLTVGAGERVAILGRMGSGKSTLLKLMAGVLSPMRGSVLYDGTDLAQLDLVTRRKVVGYLQQNPVLVSGTLKENITLGCPDASDERVLRAAKIAGVDDFARTHPDGYSMRLGEHGRGLSEGQKQVVGLAQLLLNDPYAILLDEPSSSLDLEAENRLVHALKTSLVDQALVVVTHRPAFLQLVSRIIVIDSGCVVLDGPRDDVLAKLSGRTQQTAGAKGMSSCP